MKYKYNISPEGPLDARIAIVCEKPAVEESIQNRLLIGPTGRMVRRHAHKAGLHAGRETWLNGQFAGVSLSNEVWLTNSVQSYNNEQENPTVQDILREQPRLFRELERLRNLTCIIAVGNCALASLGNFQYSGQDKSGEPTGILSYRGSVLETPLGVKMVPTPHPSFYTKGEWRYRNIVQFDFNRAVEQSRFKEIRRPYREYLIEPSLQEAIFSLHNMADGQYLSFDIETFQSPPKSGRWFISCIAFSNDPSRALCIPITWPDRSPYWAQEQEQAIWRKIAWLLSLGHKTYVTQNGLFDTWHLRRHAIHASYMAYGLDSMYMHRLLAADLPHDLGFLTSIYTDEPYYKNESGMHDRTITVPHKQFWTYNCKDAACTLEIMHALKSELEEVDQLEYYSKHMQPQWDVLLDMQYRGMHISQERLQALRSNAKAIIDERQQLLSESEGFIPNTKSPDDMERILKKYQVRYQTTPKSGKAKITEEDLLTYAHDFPQARQSLLHCIEITKQRTLLSNFLAPALDSDSFYHPSYDLSHAKTGRLSSSGADEGGFQAQNLPGSCRVMVVPDDEDCELTKADLKQAEVMVVAWDAQDLFAINAFEKRLDMHRLRACVAFRGWSYERGHPPEEMVNSIEKLCPSCIQARIQDCSHSERFIGKQGGLAFTYLMGTGKWVRIILPGFGVFMDEREARRIRDIIVSREVKSWQENTDSELKSSAWLTNACGRKREFYGIHNQDMLRQALSWKPQSVIADITNDAMIDLYSNRLSRYPKARLITQTHDSVLVNHRIKDRLDIHNEITEAFQRTLIFHQRELNIPLEIAVGQSWGEAK